MKIQDRFIEYCKINTASNPHTKTVPSTECQWDLAHLLVKQMKELGIEDAHVDEYCVVYGTIPANCDFQADVIGFIAHMDTAPEFNGKNVRPRIIENYDGNDIALNDTVTLHVSEYKNMLNYVGKDIIVTDGTSLLGGDDKAGIAIIMDVAQTLYNNPNIKHGTIKIAFTPDEEIGEGAAHFDVKKFNADYAFTLDGGAPNDYCIETFNASKATVTCVGVSTHPGSAKNTMINAINVAMDFHSCLPVHQRPEHTDGFEGFNHVHEFNGTTESAKMEYIIRNHDKELYNKQCAYFKDVEALINKKYAKNVVSVVIESQYQNMKEILIQHPQILDKLSCAMKECNLNPVSVSARGGTDGAQLTFMGLPCPNIGTGSTNCHGRYEVACIQEMQAMSELVIKICDKAFH